MTVNSPTPSPRPSKPRRGRRHTSHAPGPAPGSAPVVLPRVRSEEAMLAALDRAQTVASGRRVGIVAERRARFVAPSGM